ncbi:MAG: hypothetical protein C6I01_00095 [Epsilonproteobacteria bacterium]|jgi:septal ring factor EnvC (AmiA/AmiB activator)|nr:hypothetical protein [Campylobacterota bacterium]NPA88590.1 hypothetical protein [Campylobacterota bacterium]
MKKVVVTTLLAVGLGVTGAMGAVVAQVHTPKVASVVNKIEATEKNLGEICKKNQLTDAQCKEIEADLEQMKGAVKKGDTTTLQKKSSHHWWCKIPGLREICKLIDDFGSIGR